jgi:hypothetical protein
MSVSTRRNAEFAPEDRGAPPLFEGVPRLPRSRIAGAAGRRVRRVRGPLAAGLDPQCPVARKPRPIPRWSRLPVRNNDQDVLLLRRQGVDPHVLVGEHLLGGSGGFQSHMMRRTLACKWLERGGSLPALPAVWNSWTLRGQAESPSHSGPATRRSRGGMAEWFKAPVLKTGERKLRGFESYSLRQSVLERWPSGRRQPPAKRLIG